MGTLCRQKIKVGFTVVIVMLFAKYTFFESTWDFSQLCVQIRKMLI